MMSPVSRAKDFSARIWTDEIGILPPLIEQLQIVDHDECAARRRGHPLHDVVGADGVEQSISNSVVELRGLGADGRENGPARRTRCIRARRTWPDGPPSSASTARRGSSASCPGRGARRPARDRPGGIAETAGWPASGRRLSPRACSRRKTLPARRCDRAQRGAECLPHATGASLCASADRSAADSLIVKTSHCELKRNPSLCLALERSVR